MNKYLVIALVWLLSVNTVDSSEQKTHDKQLNVLPTDLSILHFYQVGQAKFSVLFWDIYTSKLYTRSGKYLGHRENETIIFEITYLREISSKDLVKRTVEQWEHLGLSIDEYRKFVPELNALWPNINTGDKLTLFVHNGESVFYFNNKILGVISSPVFSHMFLDIWLSPNTSQQALRAKLVGSN